MGKSPIIRHARNVICLKAAKLYSLTPWPGRSALVLWCACAGIFGFVLESNHRISI